MTGISDILGFAVFTQQRQSLALLRNALFSGK